jgi:hypothetical protein
MNVKESRNIKFLKLAYTANVPILFYGSAQVGKSATIKHFAKCIGAKLKILHPSQRDSVDFTGCLVPNNGFTEAKPPKWAVELHEAALNGEKAILFIDELTTCRYSIQAALLGVILDGVVGDFTIHPRVRRFAAANPVEEAVDGTPLAPPLSSRFVHVNWEDDYEEWLEGFSEYWTGQKYENIKVYEELDPVIWKEARQIVITFLRAYPQCYRTNPVENQAWAGKRTWDFASRMLGALLQYNYDLTEDSSEVIVACVGEEVTGAWKNFVSNLKVPRPSELFENINLLPKEDGLIYLALSSMIDYQKSRNFNNYPVWKRCWAFVDKLCDMAYFDLAIYFARKLLEWEMEVNKPEYSSVTEYNPVWQIPEVKTKLMNILRNLKVVK